jgi:hypothetical protein
LKNLRCVSTTAASNSNRITRLGAYRLAGMLVGLLLLHAPLLLLPGIGVYVARLLLHPRCCHGW